MTGGGGGGDCGGRPSDIGAETTLRVIGDGPPHLSQAGVRRADTEAMTSDARRDSVGVDPTGELPPPAPVEPGVPGAARPGHDRRGAADDTAGVVRRMSTAPKAWVRGTFADRRVGSLLERELGAVAEILHERDVPQEVTGNGHGARIDHLVVGATGVWIVRSVHEPGVVRRRRGGRSGPDRLFLDRVDRTDLATSMAEQVDAVRSVVAAIGFDWLDICPALCFTNADRRKFTKPFRIDGVWVVSAAQLVELIGVPGAVSPDVMRTVAAELGRRLPPA